LLPKYSLRYATKDRLIPREATTFHVYTTPKSLQSLGLFAHATTDAFRPNYTKERYR